MHTSSPNFRPRGLLFAALLLTAAGCSFTDGDAWGSVRVALSSSTATSDFVGSSDVSLEASPVPIEVELVRISTSMGGSGAEFDPSDPPEGYTLCHGGHCHAESGELVPYEEVRAEMQSGGGTREISLATASSEVDLSAPFSTAIGPVPIASRGPVSEVHVHSENIVLRGQIQRNDTAVPMTVRLGPVELGHLDLQGIAVGPDAPETRALDICADWPEGLFADVDLDGLETDNGDILITKIVNADAAQAIIDAFENVNWTTCD